MRSTHGHPALDPDGYDKLLRAQAHAWEDCALGDAPAVSEGAGR